MRSNIRSFLILFFLIIGAQCIIADPFPAALKVNAGQLPLKNIIPEELSRLNNNEIVLNVLDSFREIRILPETSEAKTVIKKISRIDPNFLAEAFFILPVEQGKEQAVLEDVNSLLQSVRKFDKIPYYSVHNKSWNPLFEEMDIKEFTFLPNGSLRITTSQKMRPFKRYTSLYTVSSTKRASLFESYNKTQIKYKWVTGVGVKKMYTELLVMSCPGYLFVYGLGGVKVFSFFGFFGNRIDTAFTGRMEAFFKWFHTESLRLCSNKLRGAGAE